MVWDNNNYGISGIAYLGTVCNQMKFYRTSLSEYFMTVLLTAEVSEKAQISSVYFPNRSIP